MTLCSSYFILSHNFFSFNVITFKISSWQRVYYLPEHSGSLGILHTPFQRSHLFISVIHFISLMRGLQVNSLGLWELFLRLKVTSHSSVSFWINIWACLMTLLSSILDYLLCLNYFSQTIILNSFLASDKEDEPPMNRMLTLSGWIT